MTDRGAACHDPARLKAQGAPVFQHVNSHHNTALQQTGHSLRGRRFVLLQGPSSRFFRHFGRALRAQDATVTRIGFCPGDRLLWARSAGRYLPYRGRPEAFGAWLRDVLTEDATTDIVMLGDGRAPHAAALEMLATSGLTAQPWIIEHGYLRPNLILIEPNGMGGASTLPHRDFADTKATPPAAADWPGSFARYAAMDVAYHVSNLLLAPVFYPHHRPHSGIHPIAEYTGWIRKFATAPMRRRQREAALAAIARQEGPLFLFPLQLSQDMQLVRYGTGEPQTDILRRVIRSFLADAPGDAMLVVKVHPLDNGRTNWNGLVSGPSDRILYLDGGDLDHLLAKAAGVVTINSTVGLQALQAGVPTHVLGQAIYRTAGLTDQPGLDAFWNAPAPPDTERVDTFCGFIAANFHVPGAFDGPGALAGADNLARWLANPPPANVSVAP